MDLKVVEVLVEQILKTLSARPKSTQNGYYRKMSIAVLVLGVISNTEAFPSFMSFLKTGLGLVFSVLTEIMI